ncbi:MAG TPA: MarR family winged helix-turn-helix transcriptional regulator [Solirubrobacterales bacterium]|nr:MarR family winged helix-turn-helix transcriptional regulator [Solirubrobacterales bacterium]
MNPTTAPTTATGSIGLLTKLSKVVFRRATEETIGLKLKQLMALQQLRDQKGTCLQQGLAEMLMLDANNCVLLLNELDDAGYVERRRDPEDRRRHIVEITAAGEETLAEGERRLEDLEDEVLSKLTADERRRFHGLLAKALAE